MDTSSHPLSYSASPSFSLLTWKKIVFYRAATTLLEHTFNTLFLFVFTKAGTKLDISYLYLQGCQNHSITHRDQQAQFLAQALGTPIIFHSFFLAIFQSVLKKSCSIQGVCNRNANCDYALFKLGNREVGIVSFGSLLQFKKKQFNQVPPKKDISL